MKSTEKKTVRSAIRHSERPPVSARRISPNDESRPLSEFVQVVAHRIGGLVSTIEGFTDLLIEGIDNAEDRETAFRILESVSRIETILHDLGHYDDVVDVRMRPVSVSRLLSGVLAVLADSEAGRVRVQCTVSSDVAIKIDERLVRQALLSLLRNALEITSKNQSTVNLSVFHDAETESISFLIENPGSLDTTVDSKRIFEPFYTTKAHNLGLGLTMARRFARLHGGDIVLDETANEQTTFVMSLPTLREKK